MVEDAKWYSRKAQSIDKTGMDPRINNGDICLFGEECRNGGQIGDISGAVRDRRFRALKLSDPLFQFLMETKGSAQKPD